MSDLHDQPPLPFEPAVQLVSHDESDEPQREVSLEVFSSRLFEEFVRRSAAVRDQDQTGL